MRIGYARISTDGQCISFQIEALERFGCDVIFEDVGISGALRQRAGLEETLARLQPGDELVIWKLDRLGRSLSHLVEVVNTLQQRRIGLVSISEAINTTSASGVFLFHIMAALAQFERALISERTKAGMMSARARGRHLGRPRKLNDGQIALAMKQVGRSSVSISVTAARLGVSRATVYRALKRTGVAPEQWSKSRVAHVTRDN